MTASWHIVRSVHGADQAMRKALERVGYELYYPLRRVERPIPKRELSPKQRKHHGVFTRMFHEPLFPCYIFVRFDLSDGKWREISRVLGFYGFALYDGMPASVDDSVVSGLKALEDNGAIPGQTEVKKLPFNIGDVVTLIGDGALRGLTARVQDLDERGRISVLIAMMGRQVTINLAAEDLEKVVA